MLLQSYCSKCERTVTVVPLVSADEFWNAVKKNLEVEVMHVTIAGDHVWKLNEHEKASLAQKRAEGIDIY